MFETLLDLPLAFWVVVVLLAGGMFWASGQIREGLGFPMMATLGTVAAWYVGDALYNNYAGDYAKTFSPAVLQNAWWQVALFLVAFLVLAPACHRLVNGRNRGAGSQVIMMLNNGSDQPQFQLGLQILLRGCIAAWIVLVVVAAIRLGSELPYYFFPFLGESANPWSRERVGSGIDGLLSLASYLQMFVAGAFGVVAALARQPWIRSLALIGCLLTWPNYIFDRARNTMLAVVVPGLLAWVFLRLRGNWPQKIIIVSVCFLLVSEWFNFVMVNRSQTSIASAFNQKGFGLSQDENIHQEGLNMFEELCWINTFINNGSYEPPWGQEYFAEAVNPVPRTLWPGKPMIGIDYAVLRGQANDNGQAGVAATISTGMIGQGVINFRSILGPIFVALLMSLWVAGLARLDLNGYKMGRIPLFALGMILTFNLGRDITLITLYTFVFGSALVWWLDWRNPSISRAPTPESAELQGQIKGRRARRNPQAIGPHAVSIAREDNSSR